MEQLQISYMYFTQRCCDWLVFSYLVMGQFMEQRKTWMPGYEAAINRTMEGDFAFISDRPILDYVSRQNDESCLNSGMDTRSALEAYKAPQFDYRLFFANNG